MMEGCDNYHSVPVELELPLSGKTDGTVTLEKTDLLQPGEGRLSYFASTWVRFSKSVDVTDGSKGRLSHVELGSSATHGRVFLFMAGSICHRNTYLYFTK